MNKITINDYVLPVREYNGQRVVIFKDIDSIHGRIEGTARKRFNDNKEHFIEGEDFFVRKTDEAMNEFGIIAPNGLILITESGYLMLVKSFTDDLAWKVQKKLINCYFRLKEVLEYVPKATSVGEVVNLIRVTRETMKEQGCTATDIATAVKHICDQFHVDLPHCFIKPKETTLQDVYDMIDFVFAYKGRKKKPTYDDFLIHTALKRLGEGDSKK